MTPSICFRLIGKDFSSTFFPTVRHGMMEWLKNYLMDKTVTVSLKSHSLACLSSLFLRLYRVT